MTNTNTNNLEVLFQDLCEEEVASISGGVNTGTANVSGTGNSSVRATAKVEISSSPTIDSTSTPVNVIKIFGLDNGFNNPSLSVGRIVNNPNGNFSVTVSLTQ